MGAPTEIAQAVKEQVAATRVHTSKGGLAVLLVVTVACTTILAQIDEKVVEFRVLLGAFQSAPLYRASQNRSGHVIYQGETYAFRVAVVNDTPQAITAAHPAGWIGLVRLNLYAGSDRLVQQDVPFEILQHHDGRTRQPTDATVLLPYQAQEVYVALNPAERLASGLYAVKVSIGEGLSDLAVVPRLHLNERRFFDVVDVMTTEDHLNVMYSRAMNAIRAGEGETGRTIPARLLDERPDNVVAWNAFAGSLVHDGLCTAAATAFQRAISASRRGGDPQGLVQPDAFAVERAAIRALAQCDARR